MDYVITDAAERQLDAIEAIERECFSTPWTRDQLATQLSGERHVFLAAEVEGRVAGYVGMMHVLDEGYISNVAVGGAFRRRGIGDALIEALLARCESLGLVFVTLEVRRSNAPARALYEKHGFVAVGERRNYYEQPREDAVLMTKFFKKGAEQ